MDIGDGDDWMNSSFLGREAEFDGGGGYDLFDFKGAKPLMIQLLGWMGGHIVLSIQPYLSSNFIDGCRVPPMIIVSCHLIHHMLKGSLHFILHLRHSLGEASAASTVELQVGSEPIHRCWPESSSNGVQQVAEWMWLL